jgi:hypothetical protein
MRLSESLASLSDVFEQSASSVTGLTTVLPDSMIEEAVVENGREGKRNRKLVPLSVVWLVVGMSLFRDLNVKNVLRKLVQELGLSVNWGLAEVPHQTSITGARDRVGWETLRTLYFKLVSLLLERSPEVDYWKGLPTYVLDGSGFPTPDTPANEAEFGRPKTGRGLSAFPQFRGVLLVGAWSHYVLGALFGAWTVGELTLARSMLGQIPKRSLLLQDRNFYAYAWLGDLARRGTSFVVRAKRKAKRKTKKKAEKKSKKKARFRVKDLQMVRVTKRISRHEWLGVLKPSRTVRRERPDLPSEIPVWVIKCERKGAQPIFLVTNLLDREEYPTKEVADLYWDRWEVETGLREVKCVLGANKKSIFRSKKPDRVRQETYGLLIAYNCVRALMTEAADVAGVQPRQLSLTDCLLLTRTMLVLMAQEDRRELPKLYDTLIDQMAQCVLPERRKGRRCPREVKQKMSNYKRKQSGAQ